MSRTCQAAGSIDRNSRARASCRIIVAQGEGDGVELLEGGPRGEVGGGLGERLELLIGRHDVGVAVALAAAALGVDGLGGEEAGPVEVEIGREDVLGEVVDALGVAAGDVAVAEVLADDRAVLALDEGVVVGVSGSGLGELVDVEGFEQRGDGAVDVFRAVVGVKAVEGEGEGSEQGAEDRCQARGMEVLDRADELELGDLVQGDLPSR